MDVIKVLSTYTEISGFSKNFGFIRKRNIKTEVFNSEEDQIYTYNKTLKQTRK